MGGILNSDEGNLMTETISEKPIITKNSKINYSKIIQNIASNVKNLDKLSKIIDYSMEEIMPKVFGKNIEKAYENSKKQIDYFMRHLI